MKRINYIKYLSIISSLAVVILHTNGCFWIFSREKYWISANIIESICYFAVPIFFMITGCTLLDYNERYSTKEYFIKRIKKTLIPFIVWSIFSIIWCIFFKHENINTNIFSMIYGIINTKYNTIYWFFPCLFSIYLIIPFISNIKKENRKCTFKYAIIVTFVFNSLLPLIANILNIEYNSAYYLPTFMGYVIYILIGYYINKYEINKDKRIVIYLFGILGLLTQIIMTHILSYKYGTVITTFKDYLNVSAILYSSAIFLFFKNLKNKKAINILESLTSHFSNTTFGIYLIHYYLIDVTIRVLGVNIYSIYYRIFGGIIIFLISSIMIKIMKKIPIIKNCVP